MKTEELNRQITKLRNKDLPYTTDANAALELWEELEGDDIFAWADMYRTDRDWQFRFWAGQGYFTKTAKTFCEAICLVYCQYKRIEQ